MPIYRFEYRRPPALRMQYERDEALEAFGQATLTALDQGQIVRHGDATVVDLEAFFVAYRIQVEKTPDAPTQRQAGLSWT